MSILFRIALAVGLLASGVVAAAQSRFPVPDRPVAPIISPEYSDERTRDGHGEAERVMPLLRWKLPMLVPASCPRTSKTAHVSFPSCWDWAGSTSCADCWTLHATWGDVW